MKKIIISLFVSFLLISCGKSEEIKQESSVNTSVNTGITNSGSIEIDQIVSQQVLSGSTTNTGVNTQITFSDSQIKDILLKIDENAKKQQELEKNSTGTLIQGDFKAEYIAPKDYGKDFDKIVITIGNKKYEIPGIYTKKIMEKYLNNIKDGSFLAGGDPSDVIVNGKYYSSPRSGDCGMIGEDFGNFVGFSPSGYYLLYTSYGYEWIVSTLIDIKTGKSILNIPGPITMNTWTNDKSQFIYGQVDGFGGDEGGLYITVKGSFPKTKKISDYDILGGYIDDNYIYMKTVNNQDGAKEIVIYDLNSLKEIFRKKI